MSWVNLGKQLISKYNDGYVKDTNYRINSKPYDENYLKKIIKIEGSRYSID